MPEKTNPWLLTKKKLSLPEKKKTTMTSGRKKKTRLPSAVPGGSWGGLVLLGLCGKCHQARRLRALFRAQRIRGSVQRNSGKSHGKAWHFFMGIMINPLFQPYFNSIALSVGLPEAMLYHVVSRCSFFNPYFNIIECPGDTPGDCFGSLVWSQAFQVSHLTIPIISGKCLQYGALFSLIARIHQSPKNVCMYIIYIYICIYIYIQDTNKNSKKKYNDNDKCWHIYMYIYIYICTLCICISVHIW